MKGSPREMHPSPCFVQISGKPLTEHQSLFFLGIKKKQPKSYDEQIKETLVSIKKERHKIFRCFLERK